MRDYLIFQLGTNGSCDFTTSKMEELIKTVGKDRKILFVTNYGLKNQHLYDKNNDAMKEMAKKNSNIGYADWAAAAESDPSGYIDNSDGLGVHLTDKSKDEFVKVIKEGLTNSFGSKGKAAKSGNNSTGDNKKLCWRYGLDGRRAEEARRKPRRLRSGRFKIWSAVASDCNDA